MIMQDYLIDIQSAVQAQTRVLEDVSRQLRLIFNGYHEDRSYDGFPQVARDVKQLKESVEELKKCHPQCKA